MFTSCTLQHEDSDQTALCSLVNMDHLSLLAHSLIEISDGMACLPLYFKVPGQIGLSIQCRPVSDCSSQIRLLLRSSLIRVRSILIRVYTVCHSICIFFYPLLHRNPCYPNFRTITVIIWDVQIFSKILLVKKQTVKVKHSWAYL